ncbi:recombinase family protein [Ruminiclostridium cellobioparum]|uniref:recombinase family protein n=1 Tax=Ruminiclostridium cellobioparum TaxID=29355 RepID=UPI0028B1DDD0|nr:recombinase family protein [Ruminiclostridium cellobioparum]
MVNIESKKYDIRYVAIYIRKSRAESMEDLEKHRMLLTDLCRKNNFKYVEYMEVGTSDSIDMRPKISKLLKEVEEGVYDAVCVVEYDRLGRGDLGEQDRIKKAFQKSDTLIITPDKIYDLNNDIDDTYADLKGFFARQEYKMITKRLRQGKKIGARRGQWTNGIPPFPYVYQRYHGKYNEKGLVVDDERYKVYRSMIELALNGASPRKIAENLNNKKVFTLKGNYWSAVTIQRLLMDETHLGKIISNKSQGDGHKNKRPNAKDVKIFPKSEWVIVENCHEPVKTQEEHEKIIQLINDRNLIGKKARHQTYVFSGLIKCERCGHSHTFYIKRDKCYMKPCWYINPLGEKCRNEGILVSVIEDMILTEIAKYKDGFLMDTEQEDNSFGMLQILIEEKEKLLSKQKKALSLINDAYEMGDYSREEWLERKKKREFEINDTANEIYELHKSTNSNQQLSKAEKMKALSNFFDHITATTDNASRNELYRTILESIIWYKNGDDIKIKINFK